MKEGRQRATPSLVISRIGPHQDVISLSIRTRVVMTSGSITHTTVKHEKVKSTPVTLDYTHYGHHTTTLKPAPVTLRDNTYYIHITLYHITLSSYHTIPSPVRLYIDTLHG